MEVELGNPCKAGDSGDKPVGACIQIVACACLGENCSPS